jgi:predicted RND superfamily exporter protein
VSRLLRAAPILALVLSVVALGLVPRLRLSGDLARLFPDDPPARALGAYVRAFGGGDVTTILVRGDDPAEVALAADEIARALEGRPGIKRATTSLAPPTASDDASPPDPTLVWAFADDAAQKELRDALSDDGMRARLEETRAMLLVPGGGGATAWLAHDPLRLLAIAQQGARRSVAATIGADAAGDLVADEGRARFVLVTTEGSALRSEEARRVVDALEGAIGAALPAHPGVRAGIAGGAAIARDAERMIRRDLYLSSALSTVLVAIAFLVTFRRARALLAIGPPLLIGTLWTAAVAALAPDGIAAIAMGFASVVIGVGLDTGVHVYAAVMRIRAAEGASLSIDEVVRRARSAVARPTLTAAVAAAAAFGALGLSRLPALRQLGLLCAVGEVLTAVAILALTPSIAARLERTPTPRQPPRVIEAMARVPLARRGATVVFALIGAAVVALAVLGPPRPAPAIVAMKPRGLPALEAQEEAIRLASGNRAAIDVATSASPGAEVQLVITQQGSDEAELLARGERLARALFERQAPRTVEALSSWLPSPSTIATRLALRDALDLPARADALTRVLADVGFSVEACAPAIAHLKTPATLADAEAAARRLREGALSPLVARHLARDPDSGQLLLATYVRGPALDATALRAEVATIDPAAVVTGYPVLEQSLKAALAADLPRVALVALILVAIALRTVLSTFRDVLVALCALAAELLLVALLVRVLNIPLHVYDALVLPVLIGITVDESMFLLHAMREGGVVSAIRREGRAIVATATTTAAGFAALLTCHFPGLRDLGAIGVVGTGAGLLASLLVVPAVAGALGLDEAKPRP